MSANVTFTHKDPSDLTITPHQYRHPEGWGGEGGFFRPKAAGSLALSPKEWRASDPAPMHCLS